jgi:hypothetical protein
MKKDERVFCALAVLAAMTILLLGVFGASAFGAGGGSSVGETNLSTNIDLGDLRYNMGTSDNGGGQYGLNLTLDTSCGVINNASISMSRDQSNPLRAQVYANISGLLDVTPELVDWRSQSTSVSRRGGLNFSSNAGIGSWQQQIWNGNSSVLGDIFSEANLGMSLSNVDSVSYANARYNEYDAQDWTWTDSNGHVYTQHDPARFYGWASWDVVFNSSAAAATALSMPQTSVSAVPEPSTIGLIATGLLAGLGMIWRKVRQ